MKCKESEDEPIQTGEDDFIKLQCFIDKKVRLVTDGIAKGFTQELEKRSTKLDRNAIWEKKMSITQWPEYLPIQIVRFFWKQRQDKPGNAAKVTRPVKFPDRLDVYDLCSDELRKEIGSYRKAKIERENKAMDAKRKKEEEEAKKETTTKKDEPKPMDTTEKNTNKIEPMEIESTNEKKQV
jgi:ubiquitin carboxyl-terminal hydrolase 14